MTESPRMPLYFSAIIAAVVFSALFYPNFDLTHDASWYLIATHKFMGGAELYSDIVEINPPLAFYLTVPALALSDILPFTPTTCYFLYCTAIGGLSALWVLRLIKRGDLEAGQRIILFGGTLIAFFILPIAEFGQREHLMLMLAMPYLLYLVLQHRLSPLGPLEKAVLGVFAFLGLALKPYFLLIPAGIVLVRLLRTRKFNELFVLPNLVIGALLAGYLAFIAIQHPLYLSEIVPTARLIYSEYGRAASDVWLRKDVLAFVLLLALAIYHRSRIDIETLSLMGAVVGAMASYFLQNKGWHYHILPALAFMLLVAGMITRVPIMREKKAWLITVTAALVAALTLGNQLVRGPYGSRMTAAFSPYVEAPNEPILVLSTNVWASFPFVNDVAGQWVSRYPAQWYIPGAINRLRGLNCPGEATQCKEIEAVLAAARTSILDDIERYNPTYVFIDAREQKSYFEDSEFDYRQFLGEDVRFTSIWRCYEKIGEAADYEVWKRICPNSESAGMAE